MKKLVLLFGICFLVFTFNSCKTDFDIDAKWKDIPVVYGLLDKSETTHYIRVNRAFLGKGNALEMTKIYDSTHYNTKNLDVRIEEYNGSSLLNSYQLVTVPVSKDLGEFYDPKNPIDTVFKTDAVLNEELTYILKVTNLKSGKVISSQTKLVSQVTIKNPKSVDKIFKFAKVTQAAIWSAAKNARSSQLIIRFHYDEINNNTQETVSKYVDWTFGKQEFVDMSGTGKDLSQVIEGLKFYSMLANSIVVNPDVIRKAGKVDFMIVAAADAFNTYLDINSPSNSLVQERPNYTNITPSGEAVGIFSSRSTKVRSVDLHPESLDLLINGDVTKKLGFVKSQ